VIFMSQVWTLFKCMHRKKGVNEMNSKVVVSINTQLDGFCKKFEHTKFLLISHTSLGTILDSAWLIYSGATCHMKGVQYVFKRFTKSDSKMHVEFGMGTNHAVNKFGIVSFQMELGGTLRV
jgi:hypothetical protein